MKRANEELNKLKEIQKKKEAEEMERLERYAQEKEAEKQRRADFVERKKAEKEKQVQHMREVVRPPTPHRVALATMRCSPLLTGVVCVYMRADGGGLLGPPDQRGRAAAEPSSVRTA